MGVGGAGFMKKNDGDRSQLGDVNVHLDALVDVLHGAAAEVQDCVAVVCRDFKSATQSGVAKRNRYIVSFVSKNIANNKQRFAAMNWLKSEDTIGQVRLKFESQKLATDYLKAKGLAYIIVDEAEKPKILRKKSYSDNFK